MDDGDGSSGHGYRAEARAREVASVLGLPDFVYVADLVDVGSGTREVGDGLLIANGLGAVLQVKSRRVESEAERARAWIDKHMSKAIRQANGSVRRIKLATDSAGPSALPVRCLALDAQARGRYALPLSSVETGWLKIVIVDAPHADGHELAHSDDVFVVTLHDWHELHRAIRSVTGILEYVRRVVESDLRVPLGFEQLRFRAVVDADAAHAAGSGRVTSRPWFSLDNLADPMGAQLYRELVEKVWATGADEPDVDPIRYRQVIELLDAVPPAMHATLGRWILSKREEVDRGERRASGLFVVADLPPIAFLCVNANSYTTSDFRQELSALTVLRAEQYAEQSGRDARALGIGHRVQPEGVDWLYILTADSPALPPDLRADLERRYGNPDMLAD